MLLFVGFTVFAIFVWFILEFTVCVGLFVSVYFVVGCLGALICWFVFVSLIYFSWGLADCWLVEFCDFGVVVICCGVCGLVCGFLFWVLF